MLSRKGRVFTLSLYTPKKTNTTKTMFFFFLVLPAPFCSKNIPLVALLSFNHLANTCNVLKKNLYILNHRTFTTSDWLLSLLRFWVFVVFTSPKISLPPKTNSSPLKIGWPRKVPFPFLLGFGPWPIFRGQTCSFHGEGISPPTPLWTNRRPTGKVRRKALILWVSLWPSTSVGSERWGFPWCEKPNRGENTPRNFSQQTPLNNKAGPQKET